VFGRIEVWNYWVKPSVTELDPGYEAKSLTHDLSVALSVNSASSSRALEPVQDAERVGESLRHLFGLPEILRGGVLVLYAINVFGILYFCT
jgi:hypothetical protein